MKTFFGFFNLVGFLSFFALACLLLTGNKLKVVSLEPDSGAYEDSFYFFQCPYVGDAGCKMTSFVVFNSNFKGVMGRFMTKDQMVVLEDPNNWSLTWIGPKIDLRDGDEKKEPELKDYYPPPKVEPAPWEMVSLSRQE